MNPYASFLEPFSFVGSFVEAVNAEKLFSDFFNTTDAESAMQPSAPKRVRKTRKAPVNKCYESDSEDEQLGGQTESEILSKLFILTVVMLFLFRCNRRRRRYS